MKESTLSLGSWTRLSWVPLRWLLLGPTSGFWWDAGVRVGVGELLGVRGGGRRGTTQMQPPTVLVTPGGQHCGQQSPLSPRPSTLHAAACWLGLRAATSTEAPPPCALLPSLWPGSLSTETPGLRSKKSMVFCSKPHRMYNNLGWVTALGWPRACLAPPVDAFWTSKGMGWAPTDDRVLLAGEGNTSVSSDDPSLNLDLDAFPTEVGIAEWHPTCPLANFSVSY